MKGAALQRLKFYLAIGACFVLSGLLAGSQSIINFVEKEMHAAPTSSHVSTQTVTTETH